MCVSHGMALEKTAQSLVWLLYNVSVLFYFLFITWACLEKHLSFSVLIVDSLSIRRLWGKGERWKRKRERAKGRETPDTDAFIGAFHSYAAEFDTIQSKSLPVIGLSASRVKKLA